MAAPICSACTALYDQLQDLRQDQQELEKLCEELSMKAAHLRELSARDDSLQQEMEKL